MARSIFSVRLRLLRSFVVNSVPPSSPGRPIREPIGGARLDSDFAAIPGACRRHITRAADDARIDEVLVQVIDELGDAIVDAAGDAEEVEHRKMLDQLA